ncbi:UDP-N-acetylmuramate dehydrogenase [Candidatus Nomurabacteria bacterium]|nr:UDP-N-acetylmuramate dehydrogenase [Candidatus Nomurabacteria bacterium]MCB9803446.1 UDP-N-acetylmuramate dehydrogenase [Candidatus Nomurabacteria bacterium]
MKITKDKSLKSLNTLFIEAFADQFIAISSKDDLIELTKQYPFKEKVFFILGEGSNTLFTKDLTGLLIKMEIRGREKLHTNGDYTDFKFGAGEIWRDVVVWLAEQEYSGVENLAYIPGTVGAAPVGNIAAYGQVTEDVFVELEAVDLYNGELKVFKHDDMNFKYRHSIFKEKGFEHYAIVSVTLRLSKHAEFDTSYHSRYKNESLEEWLKKIATPPYKPIDVVRAVTELRKYKLPWMDEYGTCGSFFTNPFLTVDQFKELATKIDELQQYPVNKMDYHNTSWEDTGDQEIVKIPAGRLLDELGWKGKWDGNVGTFDRHALCVITNKKATGKEVFEYTEAMKKNVKDAYGIDLKSEVVIV